MGQSLIVLFLVCWMRAIPWRFFPSVILPIDLQPAGE